MAPLEPLWPPESYYNCAGLVLSVCYIYLKSFIIMSTYCNTTGTDTVLSQFLVHAPLSEHAPPLECRCTPEVTRNTNNIGASVMGYYFSKCSVSAIGVCVKENDNSVFRL